MRYISISTLIVLALGVALSSDTAAGQTAPPAKKPAPAATAAPQPKPAPAPAPKNGTLSGFVFEDANRNAEADKAERHLPNITIRLQTPDRKKDLATTTTDKTGAFRFPNLAPGEYRLTIVIPNRYKHSTDDSFTLTLHPDGAADQAQFGLAAR